MEGRGEVREHGGVGPSMLLVDRYQPSLEPPHRGVQVVRWDGLSGREGEIALSLRLERDDARLRQRLYELIDRMGESVVAACAGIAPEPLDGLSFWWLGVVAEKDIHQLPQLEELMRCWALAELVREGGYRDVEIRLSSPSARAAARGVCERLGLTVRGAAGRRWRRLSLRAGFDRLPHTLRALIFLGRYLWRRRALFGYPTAADGALDAQAGEKCGLGVVGYFPNFDPGAAADGVFRSRYWGGLHELLEGAARPVDWLLLFSPSAQCPDGAAFRALLDRFNLRRAGDGRGRQRLVPLDGFMSWGGVVAVLARYLRLWRSAGTIRRRLRPLIAGLDREVPLWPLFGDAVGRSLRGVAAMHGLIAAHLFARMASARGGGEAGYLYLRENQPWERAMLHACRRAGGGELIGVVHSKVRRHDYRQFNAPGYWDGVGRPGGCPEPDRIAVNGRGARQLLAAAGVPEGRLVDVEALRYLYLPALKRTSRHPGGAGSLLVLGEISAAATEELLEMLAEALARFRLEIGVMVKPHPFCPLDEPLARLGLVPSVEVVGGALEALWPRVGMVFCGNTTAAALESAYLGLPTIVARPVDGFNVSSMLGVPGVRFVGDGRELAEAVRDPESPRLDPDFFFLDRDLPRWKRLLDIH
ncbi:TIGR04326 family surface carbohydrate biosynthesis protein [Endothiovibrio diazotrophicus]